MSAQSSHSPRRASPLRQSRLARNRDLGAAGRGDQLAYSRWSFRRNTEHGLWLGSSADTPPASGIVPCCVAFMRGRPGLNPCSHAGSSEPVHHRTLHLLGAFETGWTQRGELVAASARPSFRCPTRAVNRHDFDQFGEELLGLRIDGVDDGAHHAAGEQHLVDVADVPVVLQSVTDRFLNSGSLFASRTVTIRPWRATRSGPRMTPFQSYSKPCAV